MDERELLLLGLLRREEMHGYQLSQFLEHRLSSLFPMKRPTAYFLLSRLAARGLVQEEAGREGRRPEKRVYRLTPEGEAAFMAALRRHIGEHHAAYRPDAVGFLLLDMAPLDERAALLRQKLDAVRERRRWAEERLHRHIDTHAYWAMGYEAAHLRAEEEWLQGLITGLEDRTANRSNSPAHEQQP
jgi:DNA-binding PadR family transcriptional regulator